MVSDTPVTEPPYDPLLARVVDTYINLANMFTEDVSASLVIGIQELFIALAALWIILTGLMLALAMKGPVDALKEFIFLSIAWLLLSTQGSALVNEVYNTVLAVMGNGASVVFQGNRLKAVMIFRLLPFRDIDRPMRAFFFAPLCLPCR